MHIDTIRMLGTEEERVILLNHKDNLGLPFYVLLVPSSPRPGESASLSPFKP